MKLLIDMNLSPRWVNRLARHKLDAIHWSTIGAATAPDDEILAWARRHNLVVVTNDLDFSAILAASAAATPSVVQIRTQDLLSDTAVSIVANAVQAHAEEIDRGVLISIDESGVSRTDIASQAPMMPRIVHHRRPSACRWLRRRARFGRIRFTLLGPHCRLVDTGLR